MQKEITIQPLSTRVFEPFGNVIEIDAGEAITINDGFATRYHDLAEVDVCEMAGRPLISIFRGRPRPFPLHIHMMERHPLASQAFIPMGPNRFVVVVALPGEEVGADDLHAFITNGSQGVNYARGVWHFPLIVLAEEQDFAVIDRGGDGTNCDKQYFDNSVRCLVRI